MGVDLRKMRKTQKYMVTHTQEQTMDDDFLTNSLHVFFQTKCPDIKTLAVQNGKIQHNI